MSKKLITVFGATGQQGGSVVRALLSGNQFKVRGITRSKESDAAKNLQHMGVEVVSANLDDKQSVVAALNGSYGCFGVTNFWSHLNPDIDTKQGIDLADACSEAGVQHFVYSGLENVTALIGLSTPHFDAKAKVEEYLQASKLPFTIVRISAYCENFLTTLIPKKISDDQYGLFLPMGDKPMDLIPVLQIGECVHQIFLNKERFLGKPIGLSSDCLTVEEICKVLSEETKLNIVDGKVSTEAFKNFGFPGAEDLANMFTFYQSGKCVRDINLTKELDPNISTFKQWVHDNKDTLQAAIVKNA